MNAKWNYGLERSIFLLVTLAALLCLVDLSPLFTEQSTGQVRPPKPLVAPGGARIIDAGALDIKFLLQEYETVTTEIRSRIEHEHHLFVLKFTVVGAVLGLIFNFYKTGAKGDQNAFLTLRRSTGVAVCCWAAVAVAAIIDVRIFFNASLIIEAGSWVRKVEQLLLAARGFPGWEQSLAVSRLRNSFVTPWLLADRQLLTWTLYAVTLGVFVPRGNTDASRQVHNIAFLGIPLSFVIFLFMGINFYVKTDCVVAYLLWCALTLALTLLWVWYRQRLPAEGAHSG